MNGLITSYLAEAKLTDSASIEDVLGAIWTDKEIRYCYPIVKKNIFKNYETSKLKAIADIDGHTTLYQVGQYFLLEDIDIWQHNIYASAPLASIIIEEMNNLPR